MVFIALAGPALWSVCNHIDKYLLSKYFKNPGTGSLIVFSSLIGLIMVPVIYLFHPDVFNINTIYALLIIFNGVIYVLGLMRYVYALKKDEASVVVPLFQMIPMFGYVLGSVFLKEVVSFSQTLAGLLIILGALGIALDIDGKKVKLKKVFLD